MHHLLGVRRVAGVLLVVLLSACSSGGGDDGNRSTQTSVSTNAVTFTALAPDEATPAAQIVTATFGDNVAHLAVIHNGAAIANVTSAVSGRTAQISIEPEAPSELGSGIFAGGVAITGYFCADAACTSLAAGNTQTVTVNYQISPVIQTIAPYVGITNVSDTAIIRGIGFQSFAAQGITLGGIPATAFTLVNNTEIRVTYPALPAGEYDVQLDIPSLEGTIDSTARLVIVDPILHAAQTLAYPTGGPAVRSIIYDAERSALVVATDTGGGSLIRYEYAGGAWGPSTSASIGELQDVALATNGSLLLALTRTSLVPVEPATLAPGTAIAAPSLPTDTFLKNIAVTDDDRAIITTGKAESGATFLYLYSGRNASLAPISTSLNNATPAASANGSSVIFVQGHPANNTAASVLLFSSGSGQFTATTTTLDQNDIPPVVDRTGTRAVVNGVNVHGTNFELFGTLPTTTLAVAVKSDGTRAYTYDSAAAGILAFDISANIDEAAYTPLGPAAPLAGDPGSGVRMTISPDGNTLFLAGSTQVVIQPAPVL